MTRVLIVDDERATNALVTEYLGLAGFETLAVFDARAALAAVAATPANGSTWRSSTAACPTSTAWSCAPASRPRGPLPVLILTASGLAWPRPSGPGAPDGMGKPFRPKDLVAELRRLLAARPA